MSHKRFYIAFKEKQSLTALFFFLLFFAFTEEVRKSAVNPKKHRGSLQRKIVRCSFDAEMYDSKTSRKTKQNIYEPRNQAECQAHILSDSQNAEYEGKGEFKTSQRAGDGEEVCQGQKEKDP